MHMQPRTWIALAAAGLLTAALPSLGQNPGTNPGTMKPLGQSEVRTPITALPFDITEPGSYYLTDCLTAPAGQNGITVLSDDVTIDLNGFTLEGQSPSGFGIEGFGDGLTVFGGDVIGWDEGGVFGYGTQSRVEGVRAIGSALFGIYIKDNSIVRHCYTAGNQLGIYGLRGVDIEGCISADNTNSGIRMDSDGSTRNCVSVDNPIGFGILPSDSGTVLTECVASGGIEAIGIIGQAIVRWNLASGSDVGISTHGEGVIQANLIYACDTGLEDPGASAVITGNVASLNLVNYDPTAGASDWGAIVGASGLNGAWVNFTH